LKLKISIKDILGTKRWKALRRFEDGYRTKYLRGLSESESLRIFKDLYEFAVNTAGTRSFCSIDPAKMTAIIKIRSLLGAAK
jgi:hypothetical protein